MIVQWLRSSLGGDSQPGSRSPSGCEGLKAQSLPAEGLSVRPDREDDASRARCFGGRGTSMDPVSSREPLEWERGGGAVWGGAVGGILIGGGCL
jgi:hypothetical protein